MNADNVTAGSVQLIDKVTYSAAGATLASGVSGFLTDNQSAIAISMLILTGTATVASALYNIYHKHQLRQIAREQGLRRVRDDD